MKNQKGKGDLKGFKVIYCKTLEDYYKAYGSLIQSQVIYSGPIKSAMVLVYRRAYKILRNVYRINKDSRQLLREFQSQDFNKLGNKYHSIIIYEDYD